MMTDKKRAPTETSPPRPWLSAATLSGTVPAGQAWSQETLVVSYPFVSGEFGRRILKQMRQNVRKLVPLMTGIGFVGGSVPFLIAFTMSRQVAASRSLMGPSMWQYTLTFWAGMTVAAPAFFLLISYLLFRMVVRLTARTAAGRSFTVQLSSAGAEQRFDLSQKLRWSEVKKIEEWEGGVLLVAPFGKPQISVPGSAFANPEAAARFSEAAHILWRSNGDMSLVPEETRVESAPKAVT